MSTMDDYEEFKRATGKQYNQAPGAEERSMELELDTYLLGWLDAFWASCVPLGTEPEKGKCFHIPPEVTRHFLRHGWVTYIKKKEGLAITPIGMQEVMAFTERHDLGDRSIK